MRVFSKFWWYLWDSGSMRRLPPSLPGWDETGSHALILLKIARCLEEYHREQQQHQRQIPFQNLAFNLSPSMHTHTHIHSTHTCTNNRIASHRMLYKYMKYFGQHHVSSSFNRIVQFIYTLLICSDCIPSESCPQTVLAVVCGRARASAYKIVICRGGKYAFGKIAYLAAGEDVQIFMNLWSVEFARAHFFVLFFFILLHLRQNHDYQETHHTFFRIIVGCVASYGSLAINRTHIRYTAIGNERRMLSDW